MNAVLERPSISVCGRTLEVFPTQKDHREVFMIHFAWKLGASLATLSLGASSAPDAGFFIHFCAGLAAFLLADIAASAWISRDDS